MRADSEVSSRETSPSSENASKTGKKILFLTNRIGSYNGSSASGSAMREKLFAVLSQEGYDMKVFAAGTSDKADVEITDYSPMLFPSLRTLKGIWDLVADSDLLVISGSYTPCTLFGLGMARMKGIRSLVIFTTDSDKVARKYFSGLKLQCCWWLYSLSDRLTAALAMRSYAVNSEFCKKLHKTHGIATNGVIDQSDLHVLCNCITYDSSEEISRCREMLSGGKPHLPLLLYVGPWTTESRIELLAMNRPHGVVLAIVGDDDDSAYCQHVEELHDPTHGIVCLRGKELFNRRRILYKAADLFVAASTEERCEIFVRESLVCGTPVVVQSSSACFNQVDCGLQGFLVEWSNVKDVESSIKKALNFTHKVTPNDSQGSQGIEIIHEILESPRPNSLPRNFSQMWMTFSWSLRVPFLVLLTALYMIFPSMWPRASRSDDCEMDRLQEPTGDDGLGFEAAMDVKDRKPHSLGERYGLVLISSLFLMVGFLLSLTIIVFAVGYFSGNTLLANLQTPSLGDMYPPRHDRTLIGQQGMSLSYHSKLQINEPNDSLSYKEDAEERGTDERRARSWNLSFIAPSNAQQLFLGGVDLYVLLGALVCGYLCGRWRRKVEKQVCYVKDESHLEGKCPWELMRASGEDRRIWIFDTTLRDGGQTMGIDFSCSDKRELSRALDEFGVDYIEAGWPGANPTDDAFFADPPELGSAKLVAFGMTRRKGVSAKEDGVLQSVIKGKSHAVCLFGKTWDFHVQEALKVSLEENLNMIRESIAAVREEGKEAMFDCEHFFDGFKANPTYAVACARAAWEAGASWVVLCDTNGGSMPEEVYQIVLQVKEEVEGVRLGIHCHNDCGLAVANSLAAVAGGARQVQGTINGIGERCGNADLVTVMANLMLKFDFETGVERSRMKELRKISRLLDERLSREPSRQAPYVGVAAFAHKGGVHASAAEKDPRTYEHVSPELVGNERIFVVSNQAGRASMMARLRELGIEVEAGSKVVDVLIKEVKDKEFRGWTFDTAEASFEVLARKRLGLLPELFDLLSYRLHESREEEGESLVSVSVALLVAGERRSASGCGRDSLLALEKAMLEALRQDFALLLEGLCVTDVRVRLRQQGGGKEEEVRVSLCCHGRRGPSRTIGVSHNSSSAFLAALEDAIKWQLL